jgi:hypothetical protein
MGLACMGLALNFVQSNIPFQAFTGWGAIQRNSATGGAAKGMPL